MVGPDAPDFACRACGLEWGHEKDPTTDEQELAELLGVRHIDVVVLSARAGGGGVRTTTATECGGSSAVSRLRSLSAFRLHGSSSRVH